MSKREAYHLKFYKKVIENTIYDFCDLDVNEGGNYSVLTFLSSLRIQEAQSFANDLALCLNSGGNIDEGFFSDSTEYMNISYEYPNVNIDDVLLIPMVDMKSLLTEWIDFSLTPPLDGSKIYRNQVTGGYTDYYGNEIIVKGEETISDKITKPVKAVENIILAPELEPYVSQNKLTFAFWLAFFVVFSIFFFFILPLLDIANAMIPLSILGAICISFSGFCAFIYYKSWEKGFIEKVGKPKLDLSAYMIVGSLPTVLFYFIISWSYTNGPGQNLYKLDMTIRFMKSLLS